MDISNINSVYFIGVGGIGMSAIARFFLSQGKVVAGYDRTPSELTNRLVQEGAQIHYEEDVNQIPSSCKTKEDTLVVYTPAIPSEHQELVWFREQGFEIQKDRLEWHRLFYVAYTRASALLILPRYIKSSDLFLTGSLQAFAESQGDYFEEIHPSDERYELLL